MWERYTMYICTILEEPCKVKATQKLLKENIWTTSSLEPTWAYEQLWHVEKPVKQIKCFFSCHVVYDQVQGFAWLSWAPMKSTACGLLQSVYSYHSWKKKLTTPYYTATAQLLHEKSESWTKWHDYCHIINFEGGWHPAIIGELIGGSKIHIPFINY